MNPGNKNQRSDMINVTKPMPPTLDMIIQDGTSKPKQGLIS